MSHSSVENITLSPDPVAFDHPLSYSLQIHLLPLLHTDGPAYMIHDCIISVVDQQWMLSDEHLNAILNAELSITAHLIRRQWCHCGTPGSQNAAVHLLEINVSHPSAWRPMLLVIQHLPADLCLGHMSTCATRVLACT